MTFFIRAAYTWTEGKANPSGGDDLVTPRRAELNVTFERNTITQGKAEARRLLREFKDNRVPVGRQGSLSWTSTPEEKAFVFGKVLKL